MLKLDVWNIVFTIINLLVLYFIFKKFLFKPVLNVIKEREDKINGQFEEAKKALGVTGLLAGDPVGPTGVAGTIKGNETY